MTDFWSGHGQGADWQSAVSACTTTPTGIENPSLGFLYISDLLAADAPTIVDELSQHTGCANWIGTTGIGICATGVEYHNQPAVVAMVGDFPANAFRTFAVGPDSALTDHGEWLSEQEVTFSVVHGNPKTPRLPRLLEHFATGTNNGFLVGGLTSSRDGSSLQFDNGRGNSALSGVIFGESVEVSTRLTQGCTPLGKSYEITECQGQVIATLDGRPAFDVLLDEAGETLARNLERIGHYIFAGLPIRGSDTGDYLVRNLAGLDPERKLFAIAEEVSPGDRLIFCRRDSQSAFEDLRRLLHEIKPADRAPQAALYYSCVARGESQFGPGSKELGVIAEELGDIPLVGFFGNGEISRDRLYAYTGVLTLFL